MKSSEILIKDIELDKYTEYLEILKTCKSEDFQFITNCNIFEKLFIKIVENKKNNCFTNLIVDNCRLIFNDSLEDFNYFYFISFTGSSHKHKHIILTFKSVCIKDVASINFKFKDAYQAGLFLIFNFEIYIDFFRNLINNMQDKHKSFIENFCNISKMKFKESGSYPNKIYTFF